jgi:hypothetical protein
MVELLWLGRLLETCSGPVARTVLGRGAREERAGGEGDRAGTGRHVRVWSAGAGPGIGMLRSWLHAFGHWVLEPPGCLGWRPGGSAELAHLIVWPISQETGESPTAA